MELLNLLVHKLIYFGIAIGATTVGSLTGVGGGVIIKPLLDILHDFDVQTIGVLSSLTVFSMAVVSIGKHLLVKTKIPFALAVPLALGSIFGGMAGQSLLRLIVTALQAEATVTVVQNIILALLILAVYIYIQNKQKIPGHQLRGTGTSILVGFLLGLCAAFLGVGGGPINVSFVIYLFSCDTKTAALCSIIIILFAQMAKLLSVAFTTGFGGYSLAMAPYMIVGAIGGGFLGAVLYKRFDERKVEAVFSKVQLFVIAICVYNVVKNLF